MNWLNKHVDTVIVLSALIGGMAWMNGKFGEVKDEINELDKRLVRIETVMMLKEMMPKELPATKPEKKGIVWIKL